MKKIIFFLFFPFIMYSQGWIDNMQDPSVNFYETQESFNEFWENKEIEKGKGWKQFKRWENFIEPRVYPDGILNPLILFEESRIIQNSTNNSLPSNIWEQVGPDDVPYTSSGRKRGIGRVNTIAFHPTNTNIIYIGAPAGGFWKSTDGGQSWITTTDFLSNLGVSDIAVNPNNPDEIYIITGDRDAGDTYSYGLMKSIDGGLTFNTTGLSFNITGYYKGNRVLIDDNNTDVIIVATSNGIYRSTDGGSTFINSFPSTNITDIEFHPTNHNIIYGASYGNTSIYKSIDNGVNWFQASTGLPSTSDVVRACVAVTPDNPDVVYSLFGDNDNGFYGLYKSLDEGNSWTQQSNTPNLLGWSSNGSDSGGQAWYDLALAVSPLNENIVFVGGVNCWKSTDSGQNWNINTHWYGDGGTEYMHADEHMLKYNLLDNKIYSANDGGLYVSSDGINWNDISDGLHITQFYSLGVSQSVQDRVITGAQDNGTFLKQSMVWDAVLGGDGMECIIDYTNANIMYGEYYYGDIHKSTNGGNSFSSIAPSNNGAWETPYELDKNNPNILYAGYNELYKSTNGGNNWSIITNNETNGGTINEIAISKSNPNVICFSDDSDIFRTNDGGNSWNLINNNLPNKYITYILIHPNNENRVWVTLSGYNSGEKVYRSNDGGNSWQNISSGIPNIPVNCIEIDKNDSLESVYIGTDLGVYKSDSIINSWNVFNNNSLPNVIVNELEIQYQSNKLFAATYGRGLWSCDLDINYPPLAGFSFSDSIFCSVPAEVSFLNNSYYSNSYYWDFGDGNTSTLTNPTHIYNTYGLFNVKLIATGPLGVDSIILNQIINIDSNNPCVITLPNSGQGVTQTNCSGTLYDVGGPNGNYYDENNSWVTIAPIGSNQITLDFIDFDIEAPSSQTYCNWDYLEIFDGIDTASPSLGQYCNSLTGSPGIVTSSSGSVTIYLHADQAVNGRGFEVNWNCAFPSSPPITNFITSDTLSCNPTISFFDISTNNPNNWLWDFGDGNYSSLQNPTHTYSSSGVFNVKLTCSNQFGVDSLIDEVIIIDLDLSVSGNISCVEDSLLLSADTDSNNIVSWYSDSLAIDLLSTGSNFMTPFLTSSTTYFVRSSYNFPTIFGGANNRMIGNGSYNQGSNYLIFDVHIPSTLISVLVYANSAGDRTFELRDNNGIIISDTTLFIPISTNGIRIYLDFNLPVQNNMQLGLSGSNNDLYRNNSGAVFPYHIGDNLSVTGASNQSTQDNWYFMYDWEILGEPCYSDIVPVESIINESYLISQNLSICHGDSILFGSNYYDISGVYTDSLVSINGCDSVIINNLTVNSSIQNYQIISLCLGDNIIIGNNSYSTPGIYVDTLQSYSGCDSIITTELIINNNSSSYNSQTVCDGESYVVGNNIYTSTGIYIDTLQSMNLCDSILTTQLNISEINLSISYMLNILSTSVTGGNSSFTYEWSTNENTPFIIPLTNGSYWCIVTDEDGCNSDTAYFLVDNISSIYNIDNHTIDIYPNPTNGYIYINPNNTFTGSIYIYNILGECIIRDDFISFSKEDVISYNLSEYSNGLYFIKFVSKNNIINHKLILE